VTASRISFSTLGFDRYFDFNMANAENPASHKYDVANGTYSNTRKALLATSGYSSLILYQNPKNENEENIIFNEVLFL